MTWRFAISLWFIVISVGLVLILATTAKGRGLEISKCSIRQTPTAQVACGEFNVHKGVTTLRFLDRNRRAGTSKSRSHVARAASWLIKYGNHHTEQGLARMLPPHNAGWECIHSREGAWDANTGNGYYGGLQAHYNWYGVARMDLLSPLQQKWHAERQYRNSGYSSRWLSGQWPNTYPPCANLF